ncbi:tetratricopeptide repeat protein [uncultured Actinomyces sp.]|uniref:tetratricopeptide repeat protein n=1 Tax=uncultured Actinomyces sp. TaxID=249061 RepID=UPI0028EF6EA7|nr:tetratricopeptide repeat protein [uncultured Actinomyces sp.]
MSRKREVGSAWKDIVMLINQRSAPDSPSYLKIALDNDLNAVVNEAMELLKQKEKSASAERTNNVQEWGVNHSRDGIVELINQCSAIGSQIHSKPVLESDEFANILISVIDLSNDSGVGALAISMRSAVDACCKICDTKMAALCRDHWARIYWLAGDIKGGRDMHEETSKELERVLGNEHIEVLRSYNILGHLYCHSEGYDKSIEIHEKVLSWSKDNESVELYDLLLFRHSLARAYRECERFEIAINLHEQVLYEQIKEYGIDDKQTLSYSHNLAWDYMKAGYPEAAMRLYLWTFVKRSEILGENHPHVMIVSDGIGCLLTKEGYCESAIEWHRWTLSMRTRKLGTKNPDVLLSRSHLAESYIRANRVSEAISILEETLALCKGALSPDHPCTKEVQKNLKSARRWRDETPLTS